MKKHKDASPTNYRCDVGRSLRSTFRKSQDNCYLSNTAGARARLEYIEPESIAIPRQYQLYLRKLSIKPPMKYSDANIYLRVYYNFTTLQLLRQLFTTTQYKRFI